MDKPWHKLEGESEKAYNVFLMFADLPPQHRSFRELRNRTHGNASERKHIPGHWTGWRRKHNWDYRARARDRYHLEEHRKELLSEMKERFKIRQQKVDSMLDECERVLFSENRLLQMLEKSPGALVSLYRHLVQLREKTEVELLGLLTLQVMEAPKDLNEREQEEIARTVVQLRKQSKEGSTTASKLLLQFNGVSLT